MCGELSSYSDICSSIVERYDNEIYYGLKNYFSIRNVCMLSGMCPATFEPHADDYEVRLWFGFNYCFTKQICIIRNPKVY